MIHVGSEMNTYGSKNLHKCHPLQYPSWGWAAGSVGTRACRVDYEIELAEQSLLSLSSAVSAPMALGPFPHGWKTGSFWEHSPLIMSFYISAQAGQKGAILKS